MYVETQIIFGKKYVRSLIIAPGEFKNIIFDLKNINKINHYDKYNLILFSKTPYLGITL